MYQGLSDGVNKLGGVVGRNENRIEAVGSAEVDALTYAGMLYLSF